MERKNILLLMMAGQGSRCGLVVPKQFYEIHNRPIFIYVLEKLDSIKCIDNIIVITNSDYLDYTKEWIKAIDFKKVYSIITGGNGRSQDILIGLEEAKKIANDDDIVLIYDVTHPFVDSQGIGKVIEAVDRYGAATLAEYQYDTTYKIDPQTNEVIEVIPRREIIAGASPEGFLFKQIYDVYNGARQGDINKLTSAGAIALENKIRMVAVETKEINLKITHGSDMKLVEKLSSTFFAKD